MTAAGCSGGGGRNLVQYIVVRGDLLKEKSWNLGALIAQACHATAAVNHLFGQHEDTKEYLDDMDSMHKVVLEAKGEADLMSLEAKLLEAGIDHKVWIEQPENYPTCLALRPYPKLEVQDFMKAFKLYRK